MKLTEVITGVYQVEFLNTSVFLAVDEQVTVIDAGWRGCGGLILKALESLGRHPEEIGCLVATHHHPDHVGAMAFLRQKSGAKVAAHQSEAPVISGMQEPPAPQVMNHGPLHSIYGWLSHGFTALEAVAPVPVDLPLADGSRLDVLGGMEVVHCPGHTPGNICLHFPNEGLVVVGDALQYHHGQLELPHPWYTVDMEQAKDSARKLAALDFDTLAFSHFQPIRGNASAVVRSMAESLD